MNILFIGDIMGRCGRNALFETLWNIKNEYNIDYTVANGENASGGLGMNAKGYEELCRAGVDFFTMGNHTFSKKEIIRLFENGENIVRPANLPEKMAGEGMAIVNTPKGKLAIINLIGRLYIDENNLSPFFVADELIKKAAEKTKAILIDFHAEATSEKEALGYYLDGRVSAVLGTHTHIQTADERILPCGTAYITDVGRTGARDSVLGLDKNASIERFTLPPDAKKLPFSVAKGKYQVCAVVVNIDENDGKAKEIKRLCVLQK
ncbi:MAG: TIGR00282 family metallophosphoesterase [Clostridia bacterium]|nr:TIGR00282 family metallophosphoesterase [Clostridia bacterium]